MTAHRAGAFDRAACTDHPHLDKVFFPNISGPVANRSAEVEARKVCTGCLCRRDCLALALSITPAPPGIWGGCNEAERKEIRQGKRKTA